MLEVGEIVKLSNDKEYIVINTLSLHNIRYVFLISNFKPLDIVIGTEKIIDEDIVVEEVKDNNELDYVLSQFALSKDYEDDFEE